MPRRRRRHGRLRFALLLAVVVLCAVLVTCAHRYLHRDHAAELAARGGIEEATVTRTVHLETRRIHELTLRTSGGFPVRASVSIPHQPTDLPNVVAAVGYRTGRDAVELLPPELPMVFASIDYPYEGKDRFGTWDWLPWVPGMRRAALDTPSALLATAAFVESLPGADPERTIVMGVSFGGPFAAAALAADPGLDGMIYAYAGGDVALWAEHHLRVRPLRWLHRPAARLLAFLIAPLEPVRHAPRISGRPVLVVSGTEDATVNPESLAPFLDALDGPVEHVWLAGAHIGRRRAEIIQELLTVGLQWKELWFASDIAEAEPQAGEPRDLLGSGRPENPLSYEESQ